MPKNSVSTTDQQTETGSGTADRSKTERLVAYLREEAENSGGELYVKAKFIADDVEMSAKEIGARMSQLQESVSELTVEKWSYAGATTWRIAV